MKITGVIAEYNPFHEGHAYHLRAARERSGCDYIVVCMAGSYTQRGAAACLSKWDRARMALMCGADAVFELPALFAVRTADAFAAGGVGVLAGLGIDALSFGCETDDPGLLARLAALREQEPPEMSERVKRNLGQGMAHARAWGTAAAERLGVPPELVNAPNAILAAEYVRAIGRTGAKPELCPVLRRGDYHGDQLDGGGFASATAIRAALSEGRRDAAREHIPEGAREILAAAGTMHAPDDLALCCLRQRTEAELAALPDVAEGLERRVKRCAETAAALEQVIDAVKCKRYTRARLSRLIAHAMLGLTADLARRHPAPEYARLIGMRADARPLLSELKRRASLPIVSGPVALRGDEVFQLECRATDLRALQCDDPSERAAGQEFTRKFVRV